MTNTPLENDAELLPCPFCGGQPTLHYSKGADVWCVDHHQDDVFSDNYITAICADSDISTGFYTSRAAAIAVWNTRAPINGGKQ